jgi:prevent-host-death family protein
MTIHSVAEAKAQLSQLLNAALAGDEVIVSRAGIPICRIVPIDPPPARKLGFLPLEMPDDRFDALPDDELITWT